MNTTENKIITPKDTFIKMHRVQDIFRELDEETRDILLRHLNQKYNKRS